MEQVLYRKWRPKTLTDVIGQEHVIKTLKQAVLQNRIAHAYLFSGPRGTGKTSTARILAKAISCLSVKDGEPCNECHICVSVDEGRSLDLLEIDAASNRGIDDIRELRDKINFTPAESRYKVYIIDEVHMLSTPAFNAFLKTLEEPPPHAVFILATTEAHKIPATIISRCHRFDFHRISTEHIIDRLSRICQSEGISADYPVLLAIARNASGSLRDAENLLEQLGISYDSSISMDNVRDLFGMGDDSTSLQFVRIVLNGDAKGGLTIINDAADNGLDMRRFHRQIVDDFRSVLLMKSGVVDGIDKSQESINLIRDVSDNTPIGQILNALRIFENATPKLDGPNTLFLEMALIECCLDRNVNLSDKTDAKENQENSVSLDSIFGETASESKDLVPEHLFVDENHQEESSNSNRPNIDQYYKTTLEENQDKDSAISEVQSLSKESGQQSSDLEAVHVDVNVKSVSKSEWESIRRNTKMLTGPRYNIGALLSDCASTYVEDQILHLVYKNRANMERLQGEIDNPDTRRSFQDVVEKVTGVRYDFNLKTVDNGNNGTAVHKGHLVQTARSMGVIISGEGSEGKKSK